MRAIFESGFYYVYLIFIISMGLYLIIKKKNILFGLGCIVLGLGDAFHLIPRAIGLYTKTLENPSESLAMWLGIGKLITSITMTIFYVLMYLFIYKRMGKKRNIYLDVFVSLLFISRIVLLCLPQNEWAINGGTLAWGIYRNIPFVILGIMVIVLFFKYFKNENYLKLLWLATILSFSFYLPVVLFASTYSWVGMMMLPKTICYIWIGVSGLIDGIKQSKNT